eukprot:m51a1_g3105 hypothetical protein (388) ;mRNA; f:126433-128435
MDNLPLLDLPLEMDALDLLGKAQQEVLAAELPGAISKVASGDISAAQLSQAKETLDALGPAAQQQQQPKPDGDVADKAKSAALAVARVVNALPFFSYEVAKRTGLGEEAARAALLVATVGDYFVPVVFSAAVIVASTAVRPMAPVEAVRDIVAALRAKVATAAPEPQAVAVQEPAVYGPHLPREDCAFFGLGGAGKTRLVGAITGNPVQCPAPSTSVRRVPFALSSTELTLVDLPGLTDHCSSEWRAETAELRAAVFVIDVSDHTRLALAGHRLFQTAALPEVCDVPLLVVLNKWDCPRVLSVAETLSLLGLQAGECRGLSPVLHPSYSVVTTSAASGYGVAKAVGWLAVPTREISGDLSLDGEPRAGPPIPVSWPPLKPSGAAFWD